jgi:hypothetical protein
MRLRKRNELSLARHIFNPAPARMANPNPSSLFDGLLTLCYIELPRGKFSAATLFARFSNLILKSLNRLQEAT